MEKIIRQVFIALVLLLSTTVSGQVTVPLYKDSIPNSKGIFSEKDKPTIAMYLPTKEKETGTGILIFPGGGYGGLTYEEGEPIAKTFAEKGVAAFVVNYRLPKDVTMRNKSMGPLMDAQQAMKYVREHVKEYNIDEHKIGIIGFSAGGHLASVLGTHYQKNDLLKIETIQVCNQIL